MTRRSPVPLLLAFATLTAGALLAASARADESREEAPSPIEEAPSTIAVLCAPGDRFALRLVAELQALGFRVEILAPAAETTSDVSLEAAAREAGAIAAIRAVPSERGVELWIADRLTGRTFVRELAGDDDAPDRDATIALRAVELLRASLLEAALPAPPPGEMAPTPELGLEARVPAPPPLAEEQAPPMRFSFSLAPGVLLSPGGFGAAISLDLGLAWMPSEHAGVVGLVAMPLVDTRIERSQGSADLDVLMAGGGARVLFTRCASGWCPSADLGLMAVVLRSTGSAAAGFVSGESSAVALAPFARLGLAFALTPVLRLRAGVLAGTLVQRVSIHFAGDEIATWSKPLLLASAGVDFGWL